MHNIISWQYSFHTKKENCSGWTHLEKERL